MHFLGFKKNHTGLSVARKALWDDGYLARHNFKPISEQLNLSQHKDDLIAKVIFRLNQ